MPRRMGRMVREVSHGEPYSEYYRDEYERDEYNRRNRYNYRRDEYDRDEYDRDEYDRRGRGRRRSRRADGTFRREGEDIYRKHEHAMWEAYHAAVEAFEEACEDDHISAEECMDIVEKFEHALKKHYGAEEHHRDGDHKSYMDEWHRRGRRGRSSRRYPSMERVGGYERRR